MLKENIKLNNNNTMLNNHSMSFQQRLNVRRTRTRKFNLNMYWYGTLYRRINRWEKSWTFHHNPLEGKIFYLYIC